MSVQSEINRIVSAKSDISTAITNKGVTVPSGTKLDGMAALIGSIDSGGANLQTKSVTYTSNGTNTITPDEGYDGLSSVDVTVNVSSGGGGGGGVKKTVTINLTSDGTYGIYYLNSDGIFVFTQTSGDYEALGGVFYCVIDPVTSIYTEAELLLALYSDKTSVSNQVYIYCALTDGTYVFVGYASGGN